MPESGDVLTLAYGPDPLQFGELRLPHGAGGAQGAGGTPHPVVVITHGGGWRAESGLDYMRNIAEDLRRRGYATWLPEFRRVGNQGGGWPGTLEDVGRAGDYLRALATDYPLDLSRVVALGHSSGGHLALWLAARPRLAQFAADGPSQGLTIVATAALALPLAGVISLAGITDLAAFWHHQHQFRHFNLVGAFMGGSPGEMPTRYRLSSPAALLPLGVPQVLVQGTEDVAVPIGLVQAYQAQAEQAGDDVRLLELPGLDHMQVLNTSGPHWPQVVAAIDRLVGLAR